MLLIYPSKPRTLSDLIGQTQPERAYAFGAGLDLQQDWQPLQDFTGAAVINNEIQRYPAAFDPVNHRLSASSLDLTATVGAGWAPPVVATVARAASGVNAMQLDSAAGATRGRQVVIAGATYNYYFVQSVDGATVTIDKPLFVPAGARVYFMPFYGLTPSSDVDGKLVIPAAFVPAGIVAGMVLSNIYGGTVGEVVVTDVSAASVTVNSPVWVGPGSLLIFGPAIRCGQIWSRFAVAPPAAGEAVVFELEAQIPAVSIYGSWPAFWLYSKDPGDGRRNDSSEIDIFEFFNSDTGANAYTGYNHGPYIDNNGQVQRYRRPSGAWDSFDTYRDPLTDYGARMRKWGAIWSENSVSKWVDGELMKEDAYVWTSPCPAQVGINLSAGSLSPNFASNGMLPRGSPFPYAFSLRSFKVWRLPSLATAGKTAAASKKDRHQ